MSTTTRQDKEFAEEMNGYTSIEPSSLRAAIEWIADNPSTEDVYDDKKLSDWAESNGYVKE